MARYVRLWKEGMQDWRYPRAGTKNGRHFRCLAQVPPLCIKFLPQRFELCLPLVDESVQRFRMPNPRFLCLRSHWALLCFHQHLLLRRSSVHIPLPSTFREWLPHPSGRLRTGGSGIGLARIARKGLGRAPDEEGRVLGQSLRAASRGVVSPKRVHALQHGRHGDGVWLQKPFLDLVWALRRQIHEREAARQQKRDHGGGQELRVLPMGDQVIPERQPHLLLQHLSKQRLQQRPKHRQAHRIVLAGARHPTSEAQVGMQARVRRQ
mmetsp:Transcript_17516/g.56691  ORF Transcript_17516/g.56691 Transcript_17516/m.56691 type:complete len:265 (-) Transcript_17516:1921-2715(-)